MALASEQPRPSGVAALDFELTNTKLALIHAKNTNNVAEDFPMEETVATSGTTKEAGQVPFNIGTGHALRSCR